MIKKIQTPISGGGKYMYSRITVILTFFYTVNCLVTLVPVKREVPKGGNLELKCKTDSTQKSTFKWFYNNDLLFNGGWPGDALLPGKFYENSLDIASVLEIKNLSDGDLLSTVRCYYALEFKEIFIQKEIRYHVMIEPLKQKVPKGGDIELKCITNSTWKGTFKWFYNKDLVFNDSRPEEARPTGRFDVKSKQLYSILRIKDFSDEHLSSTVRCYYGRQFKEISICDLIEYDKTINNTFPTGGIIGLLILCAVVVIAVAVAVVFFKKKKKDRHHIAHGNQVPGPMPEESLLRVHSTDNGTVTTFGKNKQNYPRYQVSIV